MNTINTINSLYLTARPFDQARSVECLGPQREVIKDYIVEVASSRMPADSPITQEWLDEHNRAARIIA